MLLAIGKGLDQIFLLLAIMWGFLIDNEEGVVVLAEGADRATGLDHIWGKGMAMQCKGNVG